jgi:hypothetical protein
MKQNFIIFQNFIKFIPPTKKLVFLFIQFLILINMLKNSVNIKTFLMKPFKFPLLIKDMFLFIFKKI